jgi:ketosteroid isomerase-like protein
VTPLKRTIDWYAALDLPALSKIDQLYAKDASFKDPFNDVTGVNAIRTIFEHMFKTTEHPRFVFAESFEQNQQAFLTWQFLFSLNGQEYAVNGASHLHFDDAGLISRHRDYWDPAEELWQKLPLLGVVIRWLRAKFSASR